MSADNGGILGKSWVICDNSLELYALSVVLGELLGHISVPECVIFVLDLDNVGIKIKGQRIFDLVVFNVTVGIIVDYCRAARNTADDLVYLFLINVARGAVENYHLGILDLIVYELSHIVVVGNKGICVREHHILINSPIFREIIVERLQEPHSVVFYDNAVKLSSLGIGKQLFLGYHILRVDDFDSYILPPELRRIKLLNSFLTKKDKRFLAAVEILIVEGFLNYGSLTTL